MTTPAQGNIYSAMAAIMQDIEAIGKNRQNDAQGFSFRGIEDFMNELHPIFSAHGVICIPMVEKAEHRDAGLTKAGAIITRAIVTMGYMFTASDGSTMPARTIGEGMDSGDKATAKAISMALKSLLSGVFLVPTAEVVDADYYSPTVDAREELALKNRDKKAMESIMLKHLSDAEEASGERKKELLGLASEMRCKIAELEKQPERVIPAEQKPLDAKTVETTVLPPEPKPTRRPKATPAAPADGAPDMTPRTAPADSWETTICHIGKLPGRMNGKTLREIFDRVPTADGVQDQVQWFVNQNLPTSTNEDDKNLWARVQEAGHARRAELTTKAPATPVSTPTAPSAPEAPHQPASASGWREFVIPGKNPDYSGKALGSFDPVIIKRINDEYLPLITWETATIEQKKLKAMVALALAEQLPPAATLDGEHTKSLKARIIADGLNRNDVLSVCINNGYIPDDVKRIEDISALDAEALFKGWDILAAEVKAAQP